MINSSEILNYMRAHPLDEFTPHKIADKFDIDYEEAAGILGLLWVREPEIERLITWHKYSPQANFSHGAIYRHI